LLPPPTRLVSIIWGQSEVGTIQPVPALARACRERGICFHTDATQLIPQGLISWQRSFIDLLTFSSHKLQGPRGAGVLLHRPGVLVEAQLGGGGQEGGFRAGTEPVPLLAGLGMALAQLPRFDPATEPAPPGSSPAVRPGRDALQIRLASLGGVTVLNPDLDHRLPHHLACLIADAAGRPLPGRQLVRELSRLGVACSSGTACQSGRRQDSAVLTAMGIEPTWRQSLLRFTLGPWLSDSDLAAVPERLQNAIQACA
ncbi:MAG: aminotransferase class V-fold PLP-dependent enzyme, partial [Cyanobacteria bacterium]|nr:aminotransferase class V-fold PLP-dependent enzyme [Cyanobacteriota bacterium]